MGLNYLIAVVRVDALERVEQRLMKIGVGGLTIVKVKGLGKRPNLSSRDWLSRDLLMEEAKIEMVIQENRVEAIVDAILDAAHTGDPGDGIVTVLPVSKLYRIRTRSESLPDEA